MCEGCYEEHGRPTIITPQTLKVAKLIGRLYKLPGGGVGGNCHIVTDDWNLEDDSIQFCRAQVANGGWTDHITGKVHATDAEQLAVERELLDLMTPMSEAERASALALEAGYLHAPTITYTVQP